MIDIGFVRNFLKVGLGHLGFTNLEFDSIAQDGDVWTVEARDTGEKISNLHVQVTQVGPTTVQVTRLDVDQQA